MGRSKKTLLQALKAATLARQLAELAAVKPNGYQLARWYERRLGIAPGTLDKRPWDEFLKGQMPQQAKLSKLMDLEPKLQDLLNHPFWTVMEESSVQVDIDATLQNSVYPTKSFYLKAFLDDLSLMPALDRISLLVAMIMSPLGHDARTFVITKWLADSYGQLILETVWKPLAEFLLEVILTRCESSHRFSSARFYASINADHLNFWSIVFEDYVAHHSGKGGAAWAAWCGAISRLKWSEQELFLEYINDRSSFSSDEKFCPQKAIYKKVRNRRYKLLRKTQKLSISVLSQDA